MTWGHGRKHNKRACVAPTLGAEPTRPRAAVMTYRMPQLRPIPGLKLGLEWDGRPKGRGLWVGSPRSLRRRPGDQGRASPQKATQLEASGQWSLRYRPRLGGPWISCPVPSQIAGLEGPWAPAPGPKHLRTCVSHRYADCQSASLTSFRRGKNGLDNWPCQAWTAPGQETGC